MRPQGPSFIKEIILHPRALLAPHGGSELKSYLTQTNVLSLRHKKKYVGEIQAGNNSYTQKGKRQSACEKFMR